MILSFLNLLCVFITSLLLINITLLRLPKVAPFGLQRKVKQEATPKVSPPIDTINPSAQNPNGNHKVIQTLSATFAQLMVGIAVFDKNNELSLFNPALSQHLGLRPEWLLQQPNLLSFMDRLRDTQVLPEPKDYRLFSAFLRKKRYQSTSNLLICMVYDNFT